MFPVSHSNSLAETDCHENVTRLATRFMKKHENLPERSTSPHDLATKVCKSLLDSFPDRSLFHLLQRWGRKKKCDFTKDALNTTAVLNSNPPSEHTVIEKPDPKSWRCKPKPHPLMQSLRQSRNFCIKQKFGKTPHCIGTQHLCNNDNSGILVDCLDIAIGLMCCDMSPTHDMCFSQVWMNSLRNKMLFNVLGGTSTVPSDDNPSHCPKSPDVHLLPCNNHSFSGDPGNNDLHCCKDKSLNNNFWIHTLPPANVQTMERHGNSGKHQGTKVHSHKR